jgi:SNF2 family DNA or RNA helicase
LGPADVDFAQCPVAPWDHQKEGVTTLLREPAFLLLDDVGLGKSLQVVASICEAFRRGEIDTAIIVCPAFVRSVWASPDPLLGEFAKHAWPSVPYEVHEFASRSRTLPPHREASLQVVVTNYEFLRVAERDKRPVSFPHLKTLSQWAAKRKAWLVADESWAVKSPTSKQSKAVYLLRQVCPRVTLLNGTPGAPEELFTQFQILDSGILGVQNFYHFRAKYCVLGGPFKKIVGYQNMEDFKARTARYAMRREAEDCLDLPEKLPPSTIEAQLTPQTWAVYTQMRDELLAWLESGDVSVAAQAGVRSLRLSQILAGFLGGFEDGEADDLFKQAAGTTREVGREKLDAVLDYLSAQRLHKVVVWTRFRPEAARMAAELSKVRPAYLLVGQQDPAERLAAQRAFAPGSDNTEAAALIGHPAAGGAGINLSGASTAVYASQGWSLKDRLQSEGRIHRPGQTKPTRFVDVVATGPQGQRTIDHAIVKALRQKNDVATWTAENWKQILSEE